MGRVRNKADTGYLYLIKLSSIYTYEKEEFYKIGVSNKGVIERYRYSKDLKYSIQVLLEIPQTYSKILEIEKFIKEKYKPFLYTPKHPFAGSRTECFSIMPCVSLNDEHFTTNYTFHGREICKTPTNIELLIDKEEDFSLDMSRINLIKVIDMGTMYKEIWSRTSIGYSSLGSNPKLAKTLSNIIYNIGKNKRTDMQTSFGIYMSSNLYYNLSSNPETKKMLKGTIKYINPSREEYFTNDIFVFESFISPNLKVGEHKTYILKLLNEVLSYTNYSKGDCVNLYFINKGGLSILNKYLEVPIQEVSWNLLGKANNE